MADNLLPSSADVAEPGSLNLPEPSGPHRPVMGLLYLYLLLQCVIYSYICSGRTDSKLCMTSGFHRDVGEIIDLLGCYGGRLLVLL
jgi:hypothetical protein